MKQEHTLKDLFLLVNKKKKQLDALRPLDSDLTKNLEDWYRVELTYTSNAIEGNTLTRKETAIIIEKGLTVSGKTLVEHLEATNHVKALNYIHTISHKRPYQITQSDILVIHNIILHGIDDNNAGRYRTIRVRISGSTVVMPNPLKVPSLMTEFVTWLQETKNTGIHPVELAAEAHYRLVTIHPFTDGNGRTARLLMNLILIAEGYPPIIIQPKQRLSYINSLEEAQLGGSKEPYQKLITEAAIYSFKIYLKAINLEETKEGQSTQTVLSENIIKIGELSKITGESVATIRFWTKEGLLEVVGFTPSNYQLYSYNNSVERCKLIRNLQKQRLTLAEIKGKLAIGLSAT